MLHGALSTKAKIAVTTKEAGADSRKTVVVNSLIGNKRTTPRKMSLNNTIVAKSATFKKPTSGSVTTRNRNVNASRRNDNRTSIGRTFIQKKLTNTGAKRGPIGSVVWKFTEKGKCRSTAGFNVADNIERLKKSDYSDSGNNGQKKIVDAQLFEPYVSLGDINSRGVFNPFNFTTVGAIDVMHFQFLCQSCHMVRFATYSELRLHEDWCGRTTREDKYFRCRTCEQKYHNEIVLVRHELECTQEEFPVVKSEGCNPFNFTTIYASDFREFPFICSSCHIVSFATEDEQRRHENWCGIVVLGMRDSSICDNCGIAFRNAMVLASHHQGPPGCTNKRVMRRRRVLNPTKKSLMPVSWNTKRKKLNKSDAVAELEMSFKEEPPSLNSSIDHSPEQSLPGTSQRGNDSTAGAMIFESAIAAAERASCVQTSPDSASKNCPVCNVTIAGSVDDMCEHIQQFHNMAFEVDELINRRILIGNRRMLSKVGPTNCLDCDTLFDTRLEMTRHKKECIGKKQDSTTARKIICGGCSAVVYSRQKFEEHIEMVHGGMDTYQRDFLLNYKHTMNTNVTETCVTLASKLNDSRNAPKAKGDIVYEFSKSVPVFDSGARIKDKDATDVRVTQNQYHNSTKADKIKATAFGVTRDINKINPDGSEKSVKNTTASRKDPVLNVSDIESRNAPRKTSPNKSRIEESGSASNRETTAGDPSNVVETSLLAKDMIMSISLNRSLRVEDGSRSVGKIRTATSQNITSKQTTPQLPVDFDTEALQAIFIENGRKRLRLQTSLIPGSVIVVVGAEEGSQCTEAISKDTSSAGQSRIDNIGSTTSVAYLRDAPNVPDETEDVKPDYSDLLLAVNNSKTHNSIEKETTTKQVSSYLSNVSERDVSSMAIHDTLRGQDAGNVLTSYTEGASTCEEGQSEEQNRLLRALHLVPSSSIHDLISDEMNLRKSKRQTQRLTEDAFMTFDGRSVKRMACKKDVKSKPAIFRDIKSKPSNESRLSAARKAVQVRISPRLSTLSTRSTSRFKSPMRWPVMDVTEVERRNRVINKIKSGRESHQKLTSPLVKPQTSSTERSKGMQGMKRNVTERSKGMKQDVIESKSSPLVEKCFTRSSSILTKASSGSRMKAPFEKSIVHDTKILVPKACSVHINKSIESAVSPISSKGTSDITTPEQRSVKNSGKLREEQSPVKTAVTKSSESMQLKKNTRRNLRILEPIDDETLKCLECGSILRTAVAIISHNCSD